MKPPTDKMRAEATKKRKQKKPGLGRLQSLIIDSVAAQLADNEYDARSFAEIREQLLKAFEI